jgi:predicted adenine nucleotide alpha hydrolase (AANH) superfamily ATPase
MKLLLHACCAPCSAAILEYLLQRGIQPSLFFYNPNIFPNEEYEKRKNELVRYANLIGVEVIDGDYDHQYWLENIKGLENEPERGLRCLRCFWLRLVTTARLAHDRGFDTIATTLGSSRWKDLSQIAEAGRLATSIYPDVTFWNKNWRREGLTERRSVLLREHNFYNQTYCGCEISLKNSKQKWAVTKTTHSQTKLI